MDAKIVDGVAWDEWLLQRPIGVLATVGVTGDAHAVPVEVLPYEGRVYVWGRRTSRKILNVLRTGRASLVSYKGNSGVLVQGAARVIDDSDPLYAVVAQAILTKYKREETYGNDAIVEITPETVITFE